MYRVGTSFIAAFETRIFQYMIVFGGLEIYTKKKKVEQLHSSFTPMLSLVFAMFVRETKNMYFFSYTFRLSEDNSCTRVYFK